MLKWWTLDTFFKKELLDMQYYYQGKVEDIEINRACAQHLKRKESCYCWRRH